MVATRHSIISGPLAAGILLLCCSAVGLGQVASRTLDRLIADLGAPDIMQREEAMRILSSDTSITLTQLEEQLKNESLSPEQRCRISQAARQRFVNSPRPAMGVQFDSALPDRVAIEKVYPNFPASEVLQPGDIIVSCEGEPLHSRAAWIRLGAHIFSREPGEKVAVVVRRGSEKLNLEVALGSYSDLSTPAGPGEDRLEHAWQLRCSRCRPGAAPAPIDPQAPISEWSQEPSVLEVQKLARHRAQLPQAAMPRLVAGGEPRGGELDYEELIVLAQQNPRGNIGNRAWAAQQLAQQGAIVGWTGAGVIMQTTQQELSGLENRRLNIQRRLDQMRMPGAMQPEHQAQRELAMQEFRDHLERVKKQIEGIRAEAAEEEGAVPDGAPPPLR